ncbi:MAG: DoxX family membrane protein [bacterium]|nr:DoxX family membrane protein [bacterium]
MGKKLSDFLAKTPVQLICRLILGGIFVYAGFTKIAHSHEFARIISNYKILPDVLVHFPAVILPWIEILCGIFLIIGLFERTAAIWLAAMLAVFMVAISFNLIRGLDFDCGCFSPTAKSKSSEPVLLLIRDILMLIPAAVIIFFHREPKKVVAPNEAG